MARPTYAFCISALLCLFLYIEANAGKKLALIIGNAAYQHTAPLANPRNDAEDLANTFKAIDFEVFEGVDLDKAGMDRVIRDFANALAGAEVGVFFYAGHGLQVGGQNYLVPVDARLETAASLDFELIRLELIQRTMEREVHTNILFLDACRNNPLSRNLARSMGTRSTEIGRGLASVESGQGTLISFSTQPGNVALDGDGRNSPFATALKRHMVEPGVDLSTILIKVRTDVMQSTNRSQVPWEHSSLTSRFFFTNRSATEDQSAELGLWEKVKDSLDPDVVAEYTHQYPQGTFAVLARTLIDALQKQKEAAAKLAESEADRARKLQAARQEVEKAKEALKAAEKAKKDGANVAAIGTAAARFDGTWHVVMLSKTCKRNLVAFEVRITDGKLDGDRLNGIVTANGDLSFTRKGSDGGATSFTGRIKGASGQGTGNFLRPETGFSCSRTFTMTKVD